MTTNRLETDLRSEEGDRLVAYQDTMGVWTDGVGHAHVRPGTVITESVSEQQFHQDLAQTKSQLDNQLPWWRTIPDRQQDALANLGFELGVTKLCTFGTFLSLMKSGLWVQAKADLATTRWATQVQPSRLKTVLDAIIGL